MERSNLRQAPVPVVPTQQHLIAGQGKSGRHHTIDALHGGRNDAMMGFRARSGRALIQGTEFCNSFVHQFPVHRRDSVKPPPLQGSNGCIVAPVKRPRIHQIDGHPIFTITKTNTLLGSGGHGWGVLFSLPCRTLGFPTHREALRPASPNTSRTNRTNGETGYRRTEPTLSCRPRHSTPANRCVSLLTLLGAALPRATLPTSGGPRTMTDSMTLVCIAQSLSLSRS